MDDIPLSPPYRLATPRLSLTAADPRDAPVVVEAVGKNLEQLRPWMPWAEQAPKLDDAVERLRRVRSDFDRSEDFSYHAWLGSKKQPEASEPGGRFVGATGLHSRAGEGGLEIGYWVDRELVGRGLATEMAMAMTQAGFLAFGVDRVEIHADPENEKSNAIPARLGFTREGTLRARIPFPGGYRDKVVWCLLRSEFAGTPSADLELAAFDALDRPLLLLR